MTFASLRADKHPESMLPQLAHNASSQSMFTPYPQLSDLRTATKRKRSNSCTSTTTPALDTNLVSEPRLDSFNNSPFSIESCVGCIVDCGDKECQTSKQEQCSDQCIVIPCADTCIETRTNDHNYQDVCIEASCQEQPCEGGENCGFGSEEYLQCCTDYHGNLTSNLNINANMPQNWDFTLGDLLRISQYSANFTDYQNLSLINHETTNSLISPITNSLVMEIPQEDDRNLHFPSILTQEKIPSGESSTVSSPDINYPCRWADCNMTFKSINELVGHVNLTHLHPNSSISQPSGQSISTNVEEAPLFCRWDDCHSHGDISAIPGPSTGFQPKVALDILSSHLFQDHLGVSVPHFDVLPLSISGDPEARKPQEEVCLTDLTSTSATSISNNAEPQPQVCTASEREQDKERKYATPEPSPPPLTYNQEVSHDCATTSHVCCWESCNATFETCADLTEHLTVSHVGSGKRRYDCHWSGCPRSGSQGFTSKQKILRHLQAHTGHRPFTCTECGQHFSEAATLQQHMRRHTKEKPYVCDFPGCGKAFAITGALTIHKRTHNGERPFKCPHCDRAFSESSNLSKHLRTHTGDRPYHCPVPGCGKAFARPDQLQRHVKIHTKSKGQQGTKTVTTEDLT